ncbi:MAG: DUF72 domain-containing protein [Actinobacteria bacterium]|jgi:uncharacterized protein YecE (DUF72 family)|nr:MAG: DUF72 domain-containing protein [Actinomycetota bacterium]
MIYIGTAGFSYQDWKGAFYPEKQDKKYMLEYYSCRFPVVEVNSTWHALPSPKAILSMARRTSPEFQFIIKAYKGLTHKYRDNEEDFKGFREILRPMEDHGKLACVLAQFPWGFKNSDINRAYLRRFRARLPSQDIVVEFRNEDWICDETLELLRELSLGFCCVDEPRLKGLVKPHVILTGDIGYVRFHGRNYETWWDRQRQSWERYDYLYGEDELSEWVPGLQSLDDDAQRTYAIFNNHYRGKAPRNAAMLAGMVPTERIVPLHCEEMPMSLWEED